MPNTFTISKRNLYLIGTGIILILAILIFIILKPSSNGNNNSIAGLQTNSSSNSNNSGSSVSAEKIVIPENYPQILVKRKTNPDLNINLVAGVKKGNFVLSRTNGSVKYFDSNLGILKVGNKQVIHIIPEAYSAISTKIYELKSPKLDDKGEFVELNRFDSSSWYSDYRLNSTNDIINDNVVWFYSPVDPKLITASDYNKYRGRGVYIYTKSSKEIQGTFIKDLEKKLDFKIYDKPCEWISFINNDFICQTTQHQLVNLTTKQTFGGMGEIVEVVEDNDNNIYYRNDLNQVFKANLSNVGSPTKIFELPRTLPISKITWTNQNELLLNINQEQSDEYKAKLNEVNKASYTVEKQATDFPKNKTIELKQDGTTTERPEFKDYVVLQ